MHGPGVILDFMASKRGSSFGIHRDLLRFEQAGSGLGGKAARSFEIGVMDALYRAAIATEDVIEEATR